ncbi:hypothetical protein [Acetobacter sp. DsW_059]|uniref:hypothetical protein n=1 Tax=Acetobacter sp. DsW_059 TaxID=1670661 RepID=UPI000A39BED6|nr:hypothetical protein [Acetobacter sp. DsW_059]OUJ10197.1 hypothetical protein HK25_07800 [Acetobacter sp. DsW_059]
MSTQKEKIFNFLETYHNCKNRNEYYRCLLKAGDPYGKLALGVVEQSLFSGRVARRFAECIARQTGVIINDKLWLKISEELMAADWKARKLLYAQKQDLRFLDWITIRDYHAQVFRNNRIPAKAWTAYIPLNLVGNAQAPLLWRAMLEKDIISSSLRTVMDVLTPLSQKAGVTQQTIPLLLLYPALTTQWVIYNWNNSDIERCRQALDAMACQKNLSDREQDAMLWLDAILTSAGPIATFDTVITTANTNWRGLQNTLRHRLLAQ